jgi:hypothetical protein
LRRKAKGFSQDTIGRKQEKKKDRELSLANCFFALHLLGPGYDQLEPRGKPESHLLIRQSSLNTVYTIQTQPGKNVQKCSTMKSQLEGNRNNRNLDGNAQAYQDGYLLKGAIKFGQEGELILLGSESQNSNIGGCLACVEV